MAVGKAQNAAGRRSYIDLAYVVASPCRFGRVICIDEKAGFTTLEVVAEQNQERHLAEPVREGIRNQSVVHNSGAGPGTVDVKLEEISFTVTIKTEAPIDAQRLLVAEEVQVVGHGIAHPLPDQAIGRFSTTQVTLSLCRTSRGSETAASFK